MEIDSNSKQIIIEGKTKKVFSLAQNPDLVLVVSKDRITAGDGLKSHEMRGKAELSTQTNCALFEFLHKCGVPTHWVSRVSDAFADWEKSFVAKKCSMVPIEWVTRRVATGSFLKRNVNVQEGTRFPTLVSETFFKDDAAHDPQWSRESIVGAKFEIGGIVISEKHVNEMHCLSRLVFQLLERVWQQLDHVLVDMKVEFGVFEGRVLVSDVIDNDSWRLWPQGEKQRMLDKQIYRNLEHVTKESLATVKESFEIVAQRTRALFAQVMGHESRVAIVLGSNSDSSFGLKIKDLLSEKFSVSDVIVEVTSAHKSTQRTLDVVAKLEEQRVKVIIAVAGLSNGLGPVVSGNATLPVITCPPGDDCQTLALDVWSSLRMPSGVGVTTVLGAENAALAAALIVANENPLVWSRVRVTQTLTSIKLIHS